MRPDVSNTIPDSICIVTSIHSGIDAGTGTDCSPSTDYTGTTTTLELSLVLILVDLVGAVTDAYYISTFENTWTYASPRILGIPLWLLPLWWLVVYAILEAAPVVDRLAKEARTLIRPSWVGGDAVHKMLLL